LLQIAINRFEKIAQVTILYTELFQKKRFCCNTPVTIS